MGIKIEQTVFEALEPGTYRARIGAAALEASEYSDTGQQVALRFDLAEAGLEGRSIRAWANPKLTGGKKPSKLYTWTSVLLFGGKPLPDGFVLDLDALIDREALLVVEIKADSGYNRVASVLPLRRNAPARTPPAQSAQSPATQPRATEAQEPPDLPALEDDQLLLVDPGPTDDDDLPF